MLVFHHQLVNLGRAPESEKSQDREKRANSSIYILVGLATLREERVSPPGLTSQWRGLECYTCPAKALSQLLLLHPGAKPCRPTLLRRSMWPPSTTTQTLICSGWETLVVPISQPGTPVRDKRRGGPFVPGLATGTKGAASATWLAHTFVPVGVPFFHVFLFSILFPGLTRWSLLGYRQDPSR